MAAATDEEVRDSIERQENKNSLLDKIINGIVS